MIRYYHIVDPSLDDEGVDKILENDPEIFFSGKEV
jgi:hypothetical protein